jgi:hypothetical protein
MHFQMAVVVEEAQLAELIHEMAHPRTGRSDHLRKRPPSDFRDDGLGLALLAEVGQQKQHAGEPFFD